MTGLGVAVVLLWIVVIALAIVVYALTRQIGVLYERVAPAGALMVNQNLKVDDAAPEFDVATIDGTAVHIGGGDAPQLLFFLAPDCPICKTLLPVVKSMGRDGGTRVVLASDGEDVDEHRAYIARESLEAFPLHRLRSGGSRLRRL